jgi:23S rRNA (pseudouridine1915-N3)-methyltransferase
MKITIYTFDKARQSLEKQLAEDYIKRLKNFGWQVALKSHTVKKPLTGLALKKAEAELIAAGLAKQQKIIVLDEHGQNFSSPQLADKLDAWQGQEIATLIGGAEGLHADLLAQADLKLAFGQATWPHRLVLPMLAEQLYRVATLLHNHPYHNA